MATTSSPSSSMPPLMRAEDGNSLSIEKARVDFPHPDSPASPRVSPSLSSRETLSTARRGPLSVLYSTESSLITSRAILLSTPKPRIEQVLDADAHEDR